MSEGRLAPDALAPRRTDVDLVRVLGIVAVVVGHVYPVRWWTPGIYAWHVPVFFLLAGHLWSAKRSLREEFRRRVGTLLVPYLAWLAFIVVMVLQLIPHLEGHSTPVAWTVGGLEGGAFAARPFSAFWFVTVLFFSGLLVRLLDRLPEYVGWLVAIAGLIAAMIVGPSLAHTPLGAGLTPACALFILIGRRTRDSLASIRHPVAIGVTAVALGEIAVLSGLIRPLNLKGGDFGTPFASVVVACMIGLGLLLVASGVAPRLPVSLRRATNALAACALAVVLSHAVVLFELNTPDSGRKLDLLLALAVPWGLALLLRRTSIGWLFGAPRSIRTTPTVERPKARVGSPQA